MAANIAAVQEVDQLVKKAMKLVHSSHPNSATELRLMLDEAIKQRHGPEKMLSNSLNLRLIDEEANFPGRAVTPAPQLPITTGEIINLTNSPAKTITDSPDTIQDSDDGLSGGVTLINTAEVDDGNLKEFGDLNCCVCGEMVFTATNRLIECSKCGGLWHQECHKPAISDEEASEDHEHNWQCDACSNKPTSSKTGLITTMTMHDEPMPLVSKAKSSVTSSHSSSSSNSSSPFYKPDNSTSTTGTSGSGSSSKHGHKSSSSSSTKSHKDERASKTNTTLPSINIISAPEKHGSSTKRSSSTHSSSKNSSKNSSSKHHDSSSSKRRSNK